MCRNPGCNRSADRGDGAVHAYCADCAAALVTKGRLPLLLAALPGAAAGLSPQVSGLTRSGGHRLGTVARPSAA